MFNKTDTDGYEAVSEGIRRKTLVHGKRTLMTEFRLERGAVVPPHRHSQEQTGYLVSGRLRMRVGEESFDAGAGDSWCIAGEAEHSAEALEDSVALEVFSPVREDFLP